MIVVHHLEQSRSQRIVWLLEELSLPYKIKRYKRNPKTFLAPPELAKVHPLGKAPVVVDDGDVLIESGAIIDHLLQKHGDGSGLRPKAGTSGALHYATFLHFAEGSLMPQLLLRLIFNRMGTGAPKLMRPLVRAVTSPVNSMFVEPNLTRMLDYLESELGKRIWFAGPDFSGADIQMSFPLEMAEQRAGLGASRPNLTTFLARIRTRPAYKRAMAAIGEG